jgi:hypothetical protein
MQKTFGGGAKDSGSLAEYWLDDVLELVRQRTSLGYTPDIPHEI